MGHERAPIDHDVEADVDGVCEAVPSTQPAAPLGQAIRRATMTVGASDDPAEREADAVADRVVRAVAVGGTAVGDDVAQHDDDTSDGTAGRVRRSTGTGTGIAESINRTSARGQTRRVQRKVGFEFEDRTWHSWIRTDTEPAGFRAAHKKEVLDGSRAGLSIEADKASDTHADIEVVTVPFDETDGGAAAFDQAMQAYLALYDRLDAVAGTAADDAPLAGNTVGFDNANAMVSEGKAGGEIQMHVTQGVPLEKMASLMKALGSHHEGETDEEMKRRRPARRLMYGDERADDPRELGVVLATAPDIANRAVTSFALVKPGCPTTGRDQLIGLMSMVAYYARMFSYKAGDRVAKYRTTLMARTDFGVMFATLPDELKLHVRQNLTDLIDCLVDALQTAKSGNEDDYSADASLFRGLRYPADPDDARQGFKIPFPEITLRDWVFGMTIGIDLANKGTAMTFASGARPDDELDEEGHRLRALADMSSLDRSGETNPLAIVENRAVHPKGFGGFGGPDQTDAGEAVIAATRYFRFLRYLRDNAPGTI